MRMNAKPKPTVLALGLLATAVTLSAEAARAGSCMEFADHVVSQTAGQGSSPKSVRDLSGTHALVEIDNDAKRPGIQVCKQRRGADGCTGYKLKSFKSRERDGWTLELPMQGMVFHLVLKDGDCALQRIDVQERNQPASAETCKNPEKDYARRLKLSDADIETQYNDFIAAVRKACTIGRDYFPASERPKTAYDGGSSGGAGSSKSAAP